MRFEFPDEDIMVLVEEDEPRNKEKYTIIFDGASIALDHGVGVVLISLENQIVPYTTRLCFDCTNNMDKYEACTTGIEATIDIKNKVQEVYEDSTSVIYQVKGEWETHGAKLINFHTHIMEQLDYFDDVTFHRIPREEN